MTRCITCGADWSQGAFTPDCKECGGGALERGCLGCEGRSCDTIWRKAVIDTQDSGEAHWIGTCLAERE